MRFLHAVVLYLVMPGGVDRRPDAAWLPVGCGDYLVPVERTTAETSHPLEAALAELLSGRLTPEESERGLTTAIEPGLELSALSLQEEIAYVDLRGTLRSAGACADPLILGQIEQTMRAVGSVRYHHVTLNGTLSEFRLAFGEADTNAQDRTALAIWDFVYDVLRASLLQADLGAGPALYRLRLQVLEIPTIESRTAHIRMQADLTREVTTPMGARIVTPRELREDIQARFQVSSVNLTVNDRLIS